MITSTMTVTVIVISSLHGVVLSMSLFEDSYWDLINFVNDVDPFHFSSGIDPLRLVRLEQEVRQRLQRVVILIRGFVAIRQSRDLGWPDARLQEAEAQQEDEPKADKNKPEPEGQGE